MEQNNFLPSAEKDTAPIKIESRTIASEKHPERNEDAVLIDYNKNIFGIFDGMGGHESGEKASRWAKDYVSIKLSEGLDNKSIDEKIDYVSDTLAETNKLILDGAKTDGTNMGTTAVIGLIHEGESMEKQAIIASVGDSRAYLFRDGNLKQVTIDDDAVKYQFRNNLNKAKEIQKNISNAVDPKNDLSEEEQVFFNIRNKISSGIGMPENFRVQTYVMDIKPGDRLLLCSDGLSDNLTENQISNIMNDKKDTVNNLINEAVKVSKDQSNPRNKMDDMTVVIVDIPGESVKQIKDEIFDINIIQMGDRVNVIKSNGKMDSNYRVGFVNEDKKTATVVSWAYNEKQTSKIVSINELKKINVIPKSIEDAKNIPDLYRYLKSVGTIKNENKSYSSKDLIETIDAVINNESTTDFVTRTDGLRGKVSELLKMK